MKPVRLLPVGAVGERAGDHARDTAQEPGAGHVLVQRRGESLRRGGST